MLQRSNYKLAACDNLFTDALPGLNICRTLPQRGRIPTRMGQSASAQDLRSLLSVAAKLRQLAANTLCQGDYALHLMAAEALENRAEWLAAALPQPGEAPADPELHQPIDQFDTVSVAVSPRCGQGDTDCDRKCRGFDCRRWRRRSNSPRFSSPVAT